jgi:ubiquitin-conjugating enzyme E2 H
MNQSWTPIYELVNIFDVFLPQLLQYPNPKDPLNIDAANLYNLDLTEYEKTVRELVQKYAKGAETEDTEDDLKKRPGHKASTDIEDDALDDVSDADALSDLSETSGIAYEEELF